jgi:L-amino acid N-acyltransferase YncA/glutathione synthase/RimK-type ligase-like ATP-grasp enzyme
MLLLSDPATYPQSESDVPCFYRSVSRDSGICAFHASPAQVLAASDLSLEAMPLPTHLKPPKFLALPDLPPRRLDLDAVQVVFCRTLKPFPRGYLEQLRRWESKVRFLNRPSSKLRQMQSSFLPQLALPYLPETLVSCDPDQVGYFLDEHGEIVAKRANSTGGRGVFRIRRHGGQLLCDGIEHGMRLFADLPSLLAELEQDHVEPLLFSRFLTRVHEGDKRVLVVGGQIHGAYLRRSASGHWINNLSHDGRCRPAVVTAAELEAIADTAPCYGRMGLHVLGYDFLTGEDGQPRIGEINVGNIGGFASVERLYGMPAMERLLAWIKGFARAPDRLVIRSANRCDDAAIAAILQDAIEVGGVTMEAGPVAAPQIASKREQLDRRERLLVAECRGEVVGWAEAKLYSPRKGYEKCCETSIYLRGSEEGRGIGRRLYQALLLQVKDQRFEHVVARIVAGNDRSLAFHRAAGFDVVGVQRNIGFLGGRWYDVVILQNLLN